MAFILRSCHQLLGVLGPQRIEDVEHVGPVWLSHILIWKRVWEVNHEVRLRLHLGPDLLDRQLIVLGHLDDAQIGQLEELLLVLEDELEVVLVDHVVGWQVVLH